MCPYIYMKLKQGFFRSSRTHNHHDERLLCVYMLNDSHTWTCDPYQNAVLFSQAQMYDGNQNKPVGFDELLTNNKWWGIN